MKKSKQFIFFRDKKSIFALLLILISGCQKQKKQATPNQNSITIKTEGIECAECAKLAVEKVSTIKNIDTVRFEPAENNNFEGGSLIITYHDEISLEKINEILSTEGFLS